jgi:hypothetical protein
MQTYTYTIFINPKVHSTYKKKKQHQNDLYELPKLNNNTRMTKYFYVSFSAYNHQTITYVFHA